MSKKVRKLSDLPVWLQHQYKIAKKTLGISEPILNVLGGPSVDEAKKIIDNIDKLLEAK